MSRDNRDVSHETRDDRDAARHKTRQSKLYALKTDLPYFAQSSLVIRSKTGQLVPFVFNRAQMYVHNQLEAQKANTGKVRALILKGRQQGMSTYVGARYFHNTIFIPGTTTFILSHQAKTTDPLFGMVRRFYDNLPMPLAPNVDTANKNQLKFADVQSEYTVGTAGNEDIGRGLTIKQLHCSEAAYYTNTDSLETGLFQAIADMPGTEIILESTANGMNNMFYRRAMDALSGKGEYILLFVPWFWQLEYRSSPQPDFAPTVEEMRLKELYGLDNAQIYWRRLKIIELGSEWKFMQEYPNNPMEAFIVSGISFFDKQELMEARKRKITDPNAPVIMGVDCARTNDRSAITIRQGRTVLFQKAYTDLHGENGEPSILLGNIIIKLMQKYNAAKVFIDFGAGYGVIDYLRAQGYKKEVQGVYFGGEADAKDIYLNKRAEMYGRARDWFGEGVCSIPDDDDFYADLLIIPRERESPTNRKYLEKKEKIRQDFGRSPDLADSFVLTFAYIVHRDIMQRRTITTTAPNKISKNRPSEFETINRINNISDTSPDSVSVNVDF